MGLDRDFLEMLTASVEWKPKAAKDKWGNETYGAPVPLKAFIESVTTQYGIGDQGGQRESETVNETQIIVDAVGVKVDDQITYDDTAHTVTQVETPKDEFGDDLYQLLTVQNQKKG
jgi:hypothetical protein